ncbi:MAG: histidine kinase, partial [Cyclobacteriaceae bacterium]
INDSLGSSLSYTYIGNAHVSLGYPDQAKEYYESALKMARLVNYTKGQANALGNMGRVYRASQEYEQSLYYYRQSLAMNQELDFPEDERIDLHNIGTIYFKLKKLDSARLFFDQAKKLAREINSQRGILLANHATAVLEARRGNYAQANKLLDQSLELAQQLAMKQSVKNIYRSYSYNYEDLGEYKKALEYRIKYEKLHDSLINENHLNRITELGVQYQTAKKNEKIALLSKQKELNEARLEQQSTQNQALWGGLLLIITITVLVVYLLRQRLINQRLMSAKNEEIKTAQFKQQLSELEMKALRAQMNPHFMFNCLNSINRMVLSGDNRNAARYLTKFGKLIRLMLENSEHPTVSLADELTMLESYLELERLRFKEKISYHIRVDDRIDRETTLLPSMVLQPFIENAILLGLMHKNTPGLVEISISQN